MSHHRARRVWILLLPSIALASLLAAEAAAQQLQGVVFNNLFYVGAPGLRGDPSMPGTQGSVGCGSAWGGDLTAILNNALGQNVQGEDAAPLSGRRDLWRFCDAMTDQGGGWDVNNSITPTAEHEQNTGYAPAELFGQTDAVQSMASWQMSSVAARIQQIRTAKLGRQGDRSHALTRFDGDQRTPSITASAPAPSRTPQTFNQQDDERQHASNITVANLLREGLNAGDDAFGVGGLGVFLTGRYIRLNADTTLQELGSTTNGGGFTLGADYRMGSSFVVGGAFGFNHYSADFSLNSGSSTINDYAGLLFTSLFLGDVFYLEGLMRGSFLTTDTFRRTPTFDGGPALAAQQGSPDGWTISAEATAGAELPFGALLLNPYAKLGVYHTDIESYRERGGDGSMSMFIREQKVTSLPLTLGASVVYNFSTAAGVVSPYVRGQYMHEFLDQAAIVSGFLQVIPTASFQILPNAVDRNYGSVGAGGSMSFAKGWAGFVDFDVLLGYEALMTYTATIGVRKEL